ncbi:MAG: hypothetical protein U0V18_13715 [Anaerolineales bacterium]
MRIKPIEYVGLLAHFRAWMDRYIALNGNGYEIINMNGQRGYVIYYEPHGQTISREIWVMQSRHIIENGERLLEIRRGMILATETAPNKVNIDFVDGQYFGFRHVPTNLMMSEADKQNFLLKEKPLMMASNPIGADFVQYANEIKTEFESENKNIIIEFSQEKKDRKSNIKIEPVNYSGSVSHFRALMDKVLALNGNIFITSTNNKYRVEYTRSAQAEAREAWHVIPVINVNKGDAKLSKTWATILAIEESPNSTTVEFIDGLYYYHDTRMHSASSSSLIAAIGSLTEHDYGDWIGEDFVEIVHRIKAEIIGKEAQTPISSLWEKIPNIGWNRTAVQLWHEGYTTAEIAKRVKKDEQTVRNKIADLRREFGEEIVPFRRK